MCSPLDLNPSRFILTDAVTAELVKYSANSLLATKLNFIDEVAHLSGSVRADIEDVSRAVGLDARIGEAFLKVGPGYGSSCFPKDTRALLAVGRENSVDLSILEAVVKSNETIRQRLTTHILEEISDYSRNIAVLGITFKADTDDLRESYSLELIPNLIDAKHRVSIFDPAYIGIRPETGFDCCVFCDNAMDALADADTLIVLTEWKEFSLIDFSKEDLFKNIFDLRNILTSEQLSHSDKFYRIGGVHSLDLNLNGV